MTRNILIVEDEADLRSILRTSLESRNLKVFEACNGVEALMIVSSNKIDAILSDIDMPKMNGIELLKAVRLIDATIPICLMTGNLHYNSQVLIKLGATALLEKPLPPLKKLIKILVPFQEVS